VATTRSRRTRHAPAAPPSAAADLPAEPGHLVTPENRAILHHALEEAARLLRSDGAIAYLLDPATDVLQFADDAGITDDNRRQWVRELQVEPGVGMFGRAVAERQIVISDDYPNDPSFQHFEGADRLVATLGIHSFLVAPMIAGDRVFGAMGTYSSRVASFGEHDQALVKALADHAALAIANAELIEELAGSRADERRRATEERALREIAARITAIRDPSELLQDVVDEAARLLHAERVRIDLIGRGAGRVGYMFLGAGAHIGGAAVDEDGEPYRYGASGKAIDERRTIVVDDYFADRSFAHDRDLDRAVAGDGIQSLVITPLLVEDTLLGVLQVGSQARAAFGTEQVALAEALAHQAAIAIRNSRLVEAIERSGEEIRRRADAERSVREIAANISALRNTDAILQQTVDEARRLLRSTSARIDMLEGDGVTLRWAYASGEDAVRTREAGFDAEFRIGEGIAGRTVATGEAFRTADYLADPRFQHVPRSDALVRETGFRSVLAAPLRGESGSLGAISVSSTEVDHYDDNQAELLQGLADQAAIAIQNARLIEELDRSSTELARRADAEQSLREIAAQITAIRDPRSLLQQVVDAAKRLVDADGSVLDLVDPGGELLRWAFDAGVADLFTPDEIGVMTLPVGIGATGEAVAENRVVTASDDPKSMFPDSDVNDLFFDRTGYRSMIVAPVSGESGALGALEVYSGRPNAFDADDAGVIRSLAAQAAIAITNARLIEELDRSRREVERRAESEHSLRDIAARITSLRDPDELLARVVEESRRLLRSDGAHLTRISDDRTYLVPVIVAGGMDADTEGWLKTMQFPLGGGINGLAAAEVRPVWTSDYAADPRIPHEPDDELAADRLGLRAMAAAPLRAPEGEVIGTLAVSYRQPREIVADELGLLQGLADQAAIALANANLYELLGESEARYRNLVQNSPDLVWSIDADARFTFVSDTTSRRLTGWRADELLGRHFGALVHESSREVAEIDWTANLGEDSRAGGRELRGRVNLLHRDGHPIPTEFIAFARRDEEGRFAGANGSVRDMSEQTRLERELRESEERYRFLVENSPDIVFSTDDQGVFTYLSETIEIVTGFTPAELVGGHFSRIVDPASLPVTLDRWTQLVASPTTRQVVKIDLLKKDGGTVPVEVSTIGTTVSGAFAGIHGATRDITERERLERDLRRQAGELASNQERAHLARELHDSVTQALFSMTLVTRSTELLVDRDPAAAREKLTALRDLQREALAEMRALIFELRPGNLEQDGLLTALRTHSAALQGRIGLPIVVTSELADRLPLAIEEVLYRIAQEALHNVVKHAGARQVELAVDRGGDSVILRVRDDGKGFDAAAVPDGHLGLAGMRARAEKVGAKFEVDAGLGKGTTIEVTIPPETLARAASETAAPVPEPVGSILGSAE